MSRGAARLIAGAVLSVIGLAMMLGSSRVDAMESGGPNPPA